MPSRRPPRAMTRRWPGCGSRAGLPAEIRARTYDNAAFGPEALLSRPQLGQRRTPAAGWSRPRPPPGTRSWPSSRARPGPAARGRGGRPAPEHSAPAPLRRIQRTTASRRPAPLSWSSAPTVGAALAYQVYAGPIRSTRRRRRASTAGQPARRHYHPAGRRDRPPRPAAPLGPVRDAEIDTTKPTARRASRAVSGRRMRLKLKIADLGPAPAPGAARSRARASIRVKVDFGDRSRRTDKLSTGPRAAQGLTRLSPHGLVQGHRRGSMTRRATSTEVKRS